MEMIRKILRSKIHRATVTGRNIHYEGSISIPTALLKAADMLPYEAVHIWNITRGTRFETYTIEEAKDPKAICVNGAAAHLVEPGDLIIIACFGFFSGADVVSHQAKVVFVDEENQITVQRLEESQRLPE